MCSLAAHQTELINPLISLCSKALYAYIRWNPMKNINNSFLALVKVIQRHNPPTRTPKNQSIFVIVALLFQSYAKYDDILISYRARTRVELSDIVMKWILENDFLLLDSKQYDKNYEQKSYNSLYAHAGNKLKGNYVIEVLFDVRRRMNNNKNWNTIN